MATESNGHTQNGTTQNGLTQVNDVQVNLSKTDQDIVRLIGQYLKIVGLEYVPNLFFYVVHFSLFYIFSSLFSCLTTKTIDLTYFFIV